MIVACLWAADDAAAGAPEDKSWRGLAQLERFILLVNLRSTVWMKTVYIGGLSWLCSYLYPVFMLRGKINGKPPFLLSWWGLGFNIIHCLGVRGPWSLPQLPPRPDLRSPNPRVLSFCCLSWSLHHPKVTLSQSQAAHSLTVMNDCWIRLVGRRRCTLLSRYLFTSAACSNHECLQIIHGSHQIISLQ